MGKIETKTATAYDFSLNTLRGEPLPLSQFQGRPILVVNTASKCGFTPQYAGLEALWQRHKGSGLIVIGVPSNQFGGQEPGSADDIASFCQVNYGVSFPVAAKTDVKGPGAHPLFQWFAREGGFWANPRWNFWKFLINRNGRFAGAHSSFATPQSASFERAVKDLLR